MNVIRCEPLCAVILPLIPPHQETRTKKKKKTQTENRGNNLAALCPSLCITGMVDLKPTEVEVEQIELVQ